MAAQAQKPMTKLQKFLSVLSPDLPAFQIFARNNYAIIAGNRVTYEVADPGDAKSGIKLLVERLPEAALFDVADKVAVPTPVNWPVPDGLSGWYMIDGGMGAGKSQFAAETLDHDLLIRVGEPGERYDLQRPDGPRVIHPSGLVEGIFLAVFSALNGARVVIDGSRSLVFGAKGNATNGGISGGLYMTLTNLSQFASRNKVAVAMTLNPMVKEELTPLIHSNIVSSVTGGWLLENGEVTSSTFRLASGRVFTAESTSEEVADGGPVLGSSMISASIGLPTDEPGLAASQMARSVVADDDVGSAQEGRTGLRFTFNEKA